MTQIFLKITKPYGIHTCQVRIMWLKRALHILNKFMYFKTSKIFGFTGLREYLSRILSQSFGIGQNFKLLQLWFIFENHAIPDIHLICIWTHLINKTRFGPTNQQTILEITYLRISHYTGKIYVFLEAFVSYFSEN